MLWNPGRFAIELLLVMNVTCSKRAATAGIYWRSLWFFWEPPNKTNWLIKSCPYNYSPCSFRVHEQDSLLWVQIEIFLFKCFWTVSFYILHNAQTAYFTVWLCGSNETLLYTMDKTQTYSEVIQWGLIEKSWALESELSFNPSFITYQIDNYNFR